MPRLNQTLLGDEAKLGFVVVVGYLCLDAALGSSLGGQTLSAYLGRRPEQSTTGALQLSLLVAVATTIGLWRVFRLRHLHRLRPVDDADPTLGEHANYLGNRIAMGRPLFMLTQNMDDGNAFCLATLRRPWVILGGGLRRLVRKRREDALAVIAHECAHIAAGDASLMLVAWYVFLAYAALTVGDLIGSLTIFLFKLASVYRGYQAEGYSVMEMVLHNAGILFGNLTSGITGIVAVLGVAVAMLHFIRVREFRADEVAGMEGYRQTLISLLSPSDRALLRDRFRMRFHPSAAQRKARLSDEVEWARVDVMFVASIAFLASRVNVLSTLSIASDGPVDLMGNDELEMIATMLGSILSIGNLIDFLLGVLLASVVALHFYRVTATQHKLGASLFSRLAVCGLMPGAVFVGTLTSILTSWRVLASFAHGSVGGDQALDLAIYQAIYAAAGSLLLALGLAVAASWALQKPASGPAQEFVRLFGATYLVAWLTSAIAIGALAELLEEGWMPVLSVAWLPSTSKTTGPMASMLHVAIVILLAVLFLVVAARFLPPPKPKRTVHVSRVVDI